MGAADLKKYAMTGVTILVVLMVFNSIAKRVPAVAAVKAKVDNGF